MTQAQAEAARAVLRAKRECQAASGAVEAAAVELYRATPRDWLQALWTLVALAQEYRRALDALGSAIVADAEANGLGGGT